MKNWEALGEAQYVKSPYGKDYPRRSLGKPLLIGCLAAVAFLVFAFVVGFIAAILKRGA
jgi:hypothetical protein